MRFSPALRICLLTAAVTLCVHGQAVPAKDAPAEAKGMPARATPGDYQAHVQVGAMTLAAEFKGHAVPTLPNPLTSEDYVVVEIGLFGAPDAHVVLSAGDFSLRINGKKAALPTQPYGLVVGSVKDPEWVPPEPPASKSKTSMSSGGKGDQGDSGPPAPVKVPIEVQRAMAKSIQRAVLPEGDRTLPQAGLIFFSYRGKTKGITSLELIYAGPAGKATLPLQP